MEEEKGSKVLLFAHTQEEKQNQTLVPLPEHKSWHKTEGNKSEEKKSSKLPET